MTPARRTSLTALATVVMLLGLLGAPAAAATAFRWVEADIAATQAAFEDGRLTCEGLVQGYLDRIAAYDQQGPTLRSVLRTATGAGLLDEARARDAALAQGAPLGPLHCVPVLLKDNIDAFGFTTTAGARVLSGTRPPDDAFAVAGMRRAGAIVLGKANMDEFAFGFTGSSSLGGQVRNPYNVSYGPGGSSSGTGAAIAASLAMVGVGSDTGGSIRVPSSVQGLVGIRPSLRLISQDGVLPLASFQDTIGPMCRTVGDCARMLDAMVGFDPGPFSGQHTLPLQRDDEAVLLSSEQAYAAVTGRADGATYTDALDAQGLSGARIGVVRALFGSDPDVTATLDAAIAAMRAAGATVEDTTIANLSTVTGYSSVSSYEFRDHLTRYLSSWSSLEDLHPRTFEEVAASLGYETSRVFTMATYGVSGATRYQSAAYDDNTRGRSAYVRPRITAALDNRALDGSPLGDPYDVLLYPSVLSPPRSGAPSTGSNNRLSAFTGFPALTMPAGFTAATESRVALPIGMELLGREFAEPTLIRLAYAYERAVAGTALARQAPTTTPELGG